MPGNATRKEILFVREADARREHWEGHSLTPAEATAQSGIADRDDGRSVRAVRRRDVLDAPARRRRRTSTRRFFAALTDGRARLALAARTADDAVGAARARRAQFAAKLRERFFGFAVQDATPILAELRQIKTPYEQDVLRKSVAISSEAHKAGMRAAAPGKFEYEVEAAIEAVYLRNGAMSWGYPSIVGSGPNATILHYNRSSRKMEPGDLLLVDAAANYQGYTGDITRTYPVNGTFSREQRDIYEIVLAAQEAGMTRGARPATASATSRRRAIEVLRAGLVRLGLVTDADGPAVQDLVDPRRLALDRHGRARRRHAAAARAGHGVRHRAGHLHPRGRARQPAEDAGERRLHREGPAGGAEVPNIGVRIEDSFLLTDSGTRAAVGGVPRTIDEIERFMKK